MGRTGNRPQVHRKRTDSLMGVAVILTTKKRASTLLCCQQVAIAMAASARGKSVSSRSLFEIQILNINLHIRHVASVASEVTNLRA